jgi:non-homologous end joining protein Ku
MMTNVVDLMAALRRSIADDDNANESKNSQTRGRT